MIQDFLLLGVNTFSTLPTLAEGILEGALRGGIIGAIVGGTVGGILWLFKKKPENKAKSQGRDEEGRS